MASWPLWATASCGTLLTALLALHAGDRLLKPSSKADGTPRQSSDAFVRFRRQYLAAYFLVMFADWLQGTHMYSLYQSYGVNISALFLTGFLSSAIFGHWIGAVVDRYGRRNACLVYCALEVVINLLENVPNMTLLLVGRVLGGVSTSLLFSAFESWMVTEHRARGTWRELLPKTFAIASEGNGVLAVVAGFAAQAAADAVGEIGPFRLAVVVTVLAAAVVYSWTENYGLPAAAPASTTPAAARGSAGLSAEAVALGLCYSLFDGAMYVFVFLWYPTLEAVVPAAVLPSGLVFSSFMLCIAIGGKLFDQLGGRVREELFVCVLCGVAVVALLVPTLTRSYAWILGAFFAFEVTIGAFSPCCATLRSRHFPAEGLSNTLGLFRLPTNVLVVLGTGGANYLSSEQLFACCSGVLALSTLCGWRLLQSPHGRAAAARGRAKKRN
ncbi:hypothetical protein PybrP1_002377 [[Pythium] brassicae (nom. inval.)]|nr:hypothetical protein PybrP1_002377 [[Pythium] brassicae (nom. inval.)]